MLIISHQQLKTEVHSRTQCHFYPDPQHQSELNKIGCLVHCVVCNRIPLDIRQCVSCEAVICKQCKHLMVEDDWFQAQYSKKSHDKSQCSTIDQNSSTSSNCKKGCPNCDGNPQFLLVKSKNAFVKAKMEKIYEMHQCFNETLSEDENTSKFGHYTMMNQSTLKKHLKECKNNRTCKECCIVFQSEAEFQNHLRVNCPYVCIGCSHCNRKMKRSDFKNHPCYLNHRRQQLDDTLVDLSSASRPKQPQSILRQSPLFKSQNM